MLAPDGDDIAKLQQLFARQSAAPPELYAVQAPKPPPRKRQKPEERQQLPRCKIENIDLTGEDTRMDLSGVAPPPPSSPPPHPSLSSLSLAVPSFPPEVLLEASDAKRTNEMLYRNRIAATPVEVPPLPVVPAPVPLQPSPTTIMDETKESFPLATEEMKEWYKKECARLMPPNYASVATLPREKDGVAPVLQSARKGIRLLSELKHGLQCGHAIKDALFDIEKGIGDWITQQYLFLRCRFAKKTKDDKTAPFALIMLHRPYAEGEDHIQTQHYRALCALASMCGPGLKGIIYVNASEPYRPALSYDETHRPNMAFLIDRAEALLEEWASAVWPDEPARHETRVLSDKRVPVCRVAYLCASIRNDGHVTLLNQSSLYVPEYPPFFVDVVYTAG